jgi:outer membrane immunogenic protein
MPRFFRQAALVGATLSCATAASALPITPYGDWTLDGALRPSISPVGLGSRSVWTGFYVGTTLGGVWDEQPGLAVRAVPAAGIPDFAAGGVVTGTLHGTTGGFLGGGQVGYDFQWPFGLVTGVEADFVGLTMRNSGQAAASVPPYYGLINGSKRLDNLGSVRGRLGFPILPGILTYMTAGFAYGQAGFSANTAVGLADPLFPSAAAAVTNFSGYCSGWIAGAGVEFPLWANFSGRIEYVHYDLGTASAQAPFVVAGAPWALNIMHETNVKFAGNVIRAGVNYRFNPDVAAPVLPVIAKY